MRRRVAPALVGVVAAVAEEEQGRGGVAPQQLEGVPLEEDVGAVRDEHARHRGRQRPQARRVPHVPQAVAPEAPVRAPQLHAAVGPRADLEDVQARVARGSPPQDRVHHLPRRRDDADEGVGVRHAEAAHRDLAAAPWLASEWRGVETAASAKQTTRSASSGAAPASAGRAAPAIVRMLHRPPANAVREQRSDICCAALTGLGQAALTDACGLLPSWKPLMRALGSRSCGLLLADCKTLATTRLAARLAATRGYNNTHTLARLSSKQA